MDEKLKNTVLDLLRMDDEIFEAVYYWVNDIQYINNNIKRLLPLHKSLE